MDNLGVLMLNVHALDMLSKFDTHITMGFKYKFKALLHCFYDDILPN
jgi:hypothetical protein